MEKETIKAILDKYPGITHKVKDIPKERMREFVVYADLSCHTAPYLGIMATIIAALIYGYVLGQRDSVNLEDLE